MEVSKREADTSEKFYESLQKCITTKLEDLKESGDFAIYDVVFERLLRVSVAGAAASRLEVHLRAHHSGLAGLAHREMLWPAAKV